MTLFFDGSPGWCGYTLGDKHGTSKVNHENVEYAEYSGLIMGLRAAIDAGETSLDIRGDSLPVITQLMGSSRVKAAHLREIHREALSLLSQLHTYTLSYVRSSCNDADRVSRRKDEKARVAGISDRRADRFKQQA